MFHFIPVTDTKQKLGEEKLLENWIPVSTTLKLNAITTVYLNYLFIFKHCLIMLSICICFCIQVNLLLLVVLCTHSQFLVKAGYCK